jgi:glycosyltransferase involved in cell wall biosynthesis
MVCKMQDSGRRRRSAVIFEPDDGGHQREWLEHLVRDAAAVDPSCVLWLVVAPTLHRALSGLVPLVLRRQIRVLALTPLEWRLCTHASLTVAAFARLWVMRHYLRATRAEAGHFLSIDLPALPLALGFGAAGRRISGILFRPSVHYAALSPGRRMIGERMRDLRKSIIYRAMLRNPSVDVVLTLDPYFTSYARRTYENGDKLAPIADPVHPRAPVTARDAALADRLPRDRAVLLLFGYITERKGVLVLLDALRLIPREMARQVAVILAGRIEDNVGAAVATRRAQLAVEQPDLWCAIEDRWLGSGEIEALVARCDVVLAPYQRFVGSSGVLLWAARAGKPVLAQEFGLVGRLVSDHRLGLPVDTTDAAAIAAGLVSMVREGPKRFIDMPAAGAFAAVHTPLLFVETVLASGLGKHATSLQESTSVPRPGPPHPDRCAIAAEPEA